MAGARRTRRRRRRRRRKPFLLSKYERSGGKKASLPPLSPFWRRRRRRTLPLRISPSPFSVSSSPLLFFFTPLRRDFLLPPISPFHSRPFATPSIRRWRMKRKNKGFSSQKQRRPGETGNQIYKCTSARAVPRILVVLHQQGFPTKTANIFTGQGMGVGKYCLS